MLSGRSSRDEAFDRPAVVTLSAAHFAHDSYPAFLGILLPSLTAQMGIGLATAGVLASTIRWTALLQPVFGHLADRRDVRTWVVLAPAVTAVCMSALVLAPTVTVAAALLLVAGISHAAFHPAAGAMVTHAAGRRWGRAAAWFMASGELGRVAGPLLIAGVIAIVGFQASWIAALPGLAAAVVIGIFLRRNPGAPRTMFPMHLRDVMRSTGRSFWLLSASMMVRSFGTVSVLVFYPSLAVGRGSSLIAAGMVIAAFEFAGALGALFGGVTSDRFGRQAVLLAGLVVGVPAMLGGLLLDPGWLQVGLIAVGGFCLLTATPVQLVAMQEMLSENRSLAVGLTYFMTTFGAIIAAIAVGALGQWHGLAIALPAAMLVAGLGIPLIAAVQFRGPRGHTHPAERPDPHQGAVDGGVTTDSQEVPR